MFPSVKSNERLLSEMSQLDHLLQNAKEDAEFWKDKYFEHLKAHSCSKIEASTTTQPFAQQSCPKKRVRFNTTSKDASFCKWSSDEDEDDKASSKRFEAERKVKATKAHNRKKPRRKSGKKTKKQNKTKKTKKQNN